MGDSKNITIPAIRPWRAGETLSEGRLNETTDTVNRLVRGVEGPRQVEPGRALPVPGEPGAVQHPYQQCAFCTVTATYQTNDRDVRVQLYRPKIINDATPPSQHPVTVFEAQGQAYPWLFPGRYGNDYRSWVSSVVEEGTLLPSSYRVFMLYPVSSWWTHFTLGEPDRDYQYQTQWFIGYSPIR